MKAHARFKPPPGLGTTEEIIAAITHPDTPGLARLTYDGEQWIILPDTVILDPDDGYVYCEIVRE